MAHFKLRYPKDYIRAVDLLGKDVTLTIDRIENEEIVGRSGEKQVKPIYYFRETKKKFVANVTNAETIAAMYGPDDDAWIGKRITLFPTTVQAGRGMSDAIRIRPRIPAEGARNQKPETTQESGREPGEDDEK